MQVRNHCFLHQYLILTLILTLEISLCLEWTYFNDFDLKITIQIVEPNLGLVFDQDSSRWSILIGPLLIPGRSWVCILVIFPPATLATSSRLTLGEQRLSPKWLVLILIAINDINIKYCHPSIKSIGSRGSERERHWVIEDVIAKQIMRNFLWYQRSKWKKKTKQNMWVS